MGISGSVCSTRPYIPAATTPTFACSASRQCYTGEMEASGITPDVFSYTTAACPAHRRGLSDMTFGNTSCMPETAKQGGLSSNLPAATEVPFAGFRLSVTPESL